MPQVGVGKRLNSKMNNFHLEFLAYRIGIRREDLI